MLDLLACRSAFDSALSPDLSIEERPNLDVQGRQNADKSDGVVGINRVYQGVSSPFAFIYIANRKQRRVPELIISSTVLRVIYSGAISVPMETSTGEDVRTTTE